MESFFLEKDWGCFGVLCMVKVQAGQVINFPFSLLPSEVAQSGVPSPCPVGTRRPQPQPL